MALSIGEIADLGAVAFVFSITGHNDQAGKQRRNTEENKELLSDTFEVAYSAT